MVDQKFIIVRFLQKEGNELHSEETKTHTIKLPN